MSASLAQLQAGEPVTIGRPLPNYGLLVIHPDVDMKEGMQSFIERRPAVFTGR